MPQNPAMPRTTKGQPLLKEFPVNGSFYIGIYQGTISAQDIIIRYRQKENGLWSNPRTPKHIHWAVDLLIKQNIENNETQRLIEYLIDIWNNNIQPIRSEEDRERILNTQTLLEEVNEEVSRYPTLVGKGEYSVKFLLLLARLLMIQEKTNNEGAFMFKNLLEQLKEHKDIFQIVSTATHR